MRVLNSYDFATLMILQRSRRKSMRPAPPNRMYGRLFLSAEYSLAASIFWLLSVEKEELSSWVAAIVAVPTGVPPKKY